MTLGATAGAKVRLVIWCKSSGRRTAALLLTNAAAQVADADGIFGERRLSPPSCTHGCALSQKISLSGLTQLASSSVPAMIIVTFGKISASSISADPHFGQKRRQVALPLSPPAGECLHDNARQTIQPEHVMASGALPSGFPAIEIDGEFYWDGGLVSNTPLQYILENVAAAQY